MNIITNKICYTESPENDFDRALVFPDHEPDAITSIYYSFVTEKYGKDFWRICHAPGNFEPIGGAEKTLPEDEMLVHEGRIGPYYSSAIIFGVWQYQPDYSKQQTPEDRKREGIRVRNEHLELFMTYLIQHDISFAESLPLRVTDEGRKALDELCQIDRERS